MNSFIIKTGYEMFSDLQGFLLESRRMPDGGKRAVVTNMTIEEVDRHSFIQPSFTLEREEVQALFDQLWQQGYRPKDGTGNSGHVAAIQYHLEDMRKLVFVNTQSKGGQP